ncbi:MAG: hypothetical protein FWG10_14480 [Eubacteriaceae bacterium]|nr:hypothetical protein [Eubacteriaceae bacterium]
MIVYFVELTLVNVSIDLAGIVQLEFANLKAYQHIGFQYFVIENHVNIIVDISDSNALLGADKHKAAPKLQEKILDPLNQFFLKSVFFYGLIFGYAEKL